MNIWKIGGHAAVAVGVAAAVGTVGARVEAPMLNGEWSQSNGDRFAAGFGTVMGVVVGAGGASSAAANGHGLLAMAGLGLAVGSIAAYAGAIRLGA